MDDACMARPVAGPSQAKTTADCSWSFPSHSCPVVLTAVMNKNVACWYSYPMGPTYVFLYVDKHSAGGNQ